MRLFELFNTDVPVSFRNTGKALYATSRIGKRDIKYISKEHLTSELSEQEIEESHLEGIEEYWSVVFYEDQNGVRNFDETGSGNAEAVLSLMIKFFKKLIELHGPKAIIFSSSVKQSGKNPIARAKIYEKMITRNFKEYELIKTDELYQLDQITFCMIKI